MKSVDKAKASVRNKGVNGVNMANISTLDTNVVEKAKTKQSKWTEHTWSKYIFTFHIF